MGQYAAMSTAFDTDPKILRLDIFGRYTFLLIVRLCKLHGWGGKVAIEHWDPDYLANMSGATGFESNVKNQMQKIVDAGLLKITDSQIIIPNWSSYQRDPTNSDRQRRHQESKRVTLDNENCTIGLERIGNDRTVSAPAPDVDEIEEEKPAPRSTPIQGQTVYHWPHADERLALEIAVTIKRDFPRLDHGEVLTAARGKWQDNPIHTLKRWIYSECTYADRDQRRQYERDNPQPKPRMKCKCEVCGQLDDALSSGKCSSCYSKSISGGVEPSEEQKQAIADLIARTGAAVELPDESEG